MIIRSIISLFALLLAVASQPAAAGNLDVLLSGVFPDQQATYIGYESVERRTFLPPPILNANTWLWTSASNLTRPATNYRQASTRSVWRC